MQYMCRMGSEPGASRTDQVLKTASAIAQLRAGGADSLAVPAAKLSFWRQLQKFESEAANTNDDELPEMDPDEEDPLPIDDEGPMPAD